MIPGTHFRDVLERLVDPDQFTAPIDTTSVSKDRAIALLSSLLLIRIAEEYIAELVIERHAKCPCHLSIGQEAIAVGVSENLEASDRVFSGHRSHAHYLALNASLDGLMAEILGRQTGSSRGMGGSMHLIAADVGFHGSVPIVAGTIPIALGAALAAKMDGSNALAVAYFGDGASEEGVLHETLNLAATMQLPILFVCENNLFSSHLDLHLRQPLNRVSRYADAHDIQSVVVDGNDVLEVSNAAARLIEDARKLRKPGFLEAVTYRHRGHVGPNEDIDVGVYRRLDLLQAWKQRDPIERLKQGLLATGQLKPNDISKMEHKIRNRCESAIKKAKSAPFPPESDLLDLVYKEQIR